MEPDPFRHVPRLPRRQSGIPLHAVGHADAQHLRLAEALLPARRRLRQDLQGADGDHRLGRLRHRPLREVRELHGALRLRADRGRSHDGASARGAGDRLARRQDRRADGAGNLARRSAAGAIRLRRPSAADAVGDARQRGAREGGEGGPKSASAAQPIRHPEVRAKSRLEVRRPGRRGDMPSRAATRPPQVDA